MMDVAEHIRLRSMLSEADAIDRDFNILDILVRSQGIDDL